MKLEIYVAEPFEPVRVGTLFVPTLLMQFLRGRDKTVPTFL